MDFLQRTHSPPRFQGLLLALLLAVGAGSVFSASTSDPYAAWDSDLTAPATPPFPAIAPFSAEYRFGWGGLPAGGATVRVTEPAPGRRAIEAEGGPSGLVRSLWNYHARYFGEAGAEGETPSWFHIDEEVARGDLVSRAWFAGNAVLASHRFTAESKPWWFTPLPGVRDLFAAMLFVRSLPLREGDVIRITVFPDRNPYLVELKVAGRETLRVTGHPAKAARFSIRIWSIETTGPSIGKITPHRKFRSGRIWMSDDARRIPLRAEVDVFIGSVFAELVRIDHPN